MLAHYGMGDDPEAGYRVWQTVTPMALSVARPTGKKNGLKRASVEHRAAGVVVQALRHAGVKGRPTSIRVQREPFNAKGTMAGDFAPGTRFSPSRLWHVEIAFAEGQIGPLAAGDGRYLGLGLMRPVKKIEGVFAFHIIDGYSNQSTAEKIVASALRRAVMALVQASLGPRVPLPTFFTGHEADGSPARRGGRTHLAFAFDAPRQRLIVVAPHVMERREPSETERKHLSLLKQALSSLSELRAGSMGLLRLVPELVFDDSDPLFCFSRTWVAQTRYRPTRYFKHTAQEEALISDLKVELLRRNIPSPASVEDLEVARGPRSCLTARMKLFFARAVRGPLLLGKESNLGGGLFASAKPLRDPTQTETVNAGLGAD
jgi:CRISPR-associated protein Csb2